MDVERRNRDEPFEFERRMKDRPKQHPDLHSFMENIRKIFNIKS